MLFLMVLITVALVVVQEMGTYTHARPEDLALAAAELGRIHNPGVTKV
jgi:hypothetical protein